jgi:hypothetical protein
MHVVPGMSRGGDSREWRKLLKAVDDNAAGPGWLSYT